MKYFPDKIHLLQQELIEVVFFYLKTLILFPRESNLRRNINVLIIWTD